MHQVRPSAENKFLQNRFLVDVTLLLVQARESTVTCDTESETMTN